jgi:hypothetical protein
VDAAETAEEEGAAEVRDYACLAHRIFASLRAGGAEGVYDAVVVVAEGG